MGAWGSGTFENDDALDWANDLTDCESVGEIVRRTVARAEVDSDMALNVGAAVLVAAEVVVTAAGLPGEELPAELAHWLPTMDGTVGREELAALLKCVERVGDATHSELAALWADGEGYHAWVDRVNSLLSRLRRSQLTLG